MYVLSMSLKLCPHRLNVQKGSYKEEYSSNLGYEQSNCLDP